MTCIACVSVGRVQSNGLIQEENAIAAIVVLLMVAFLIYVMIRMRYSTHFKKYPHRLSCNSSNKKITRDDSPVPDATDQMDDAHGEKDQESPDASSARRSNIPQSFTTTSGLLNSVFEIPRFLSRTGRGYAKQRSLENMEPLILSPDLQF